MTVTHMPSAVKIEAPVTPHPGKVLVRRDHAATKSKGGILLTETGREKPSQGEVVAVGAAKVLDSGAVRETFCKVGDRVVFTKYAGTSLFVCEVEHVVLNDVDVLATIGPGVEVG